MRRGLLCAGWFPRRSAAQQGGLAAIKPLSERAPVSQDHPFVWAAPPSIAQHGGEQGGPLPGAAKACNGAAACAMGAQMGL